MMNAGTSSISRLEETPPVKTDGEIEIAREERKATGKSIAIIIFLSVMSLALYHIIQRKTTILTGVLVPALILFVYLFFVIHLSQREKEKKRKQLETVNELELSIQSENRKPELHKKISTISSASLPSTSNSVRDYPTHSLSKSSSLAKMVVVDPSGRSKKPRPFVKAPSQSHIQVKNNILTHDKTHFENERKKLKKSRSFDKNTFEANKRIKTKALI